MASSMPQVKKNGDDSLGQGKEKISEEEQLELSMNHLNLLHIRCRELRITVQDMLDSIPNNASSGDIYENLMKSIGIADKQLQDFNVLYNSEKSKKVLDEAKKSQDANPKGIKPWRFKDHPDWMDLKN